MQLGELLIKNGLINQDQLNKALEAQKASGKKIGESLIELGFIDKAQLENALSSQ